MFQIYMTWISKMVAPWRPPSRISENVNNFELDRPICAKFGDQMHHAHAQMTHDQNSKPELFCVTSLLWRIKMYIVGSGPKPSMSRFAFVLKQPNNCPELIRIMLKCRKAFKVTWMVCTESGITCQKHSCHSFVTWMLLARHTTGELCRQLTKSEI